MSRQVNLKSPRRKNILEHYGLSCVWCSISLNEDNASLDHTLCVSEGGSDWRGNLLPSCRKCNGDRGCKPARAWLQSCTDRGFKVRTRVVQKALKRMEDPRSVYEHWIKHNLRIQGKLTPGESVEINQLIPIAFVPAGVQKRLRTESLIRMRESCEYIFGRSQFSLSELVTHQPSLFCQSR